MSDIFGLISRNHQPVPLLGVEAEGHLLGRGARLTLRQRFRNQEKSAIEAVYKFPLPENSAVSGFKVWVGERVVEGIVEERDKAFEKYDDAMMRGDGAYLLDEERPNIFTLSVGNLNPGMEATVEITLVMLMDSEGPQYRLTLPTSISPRYIPDHQPDDLGIPVSEVLHPDYAPQVPYGLSLRLHIHHPGKLAAVESPSHPVKINLSQDQVQVEFASEKVQMDRDFVLMIDPGEEAAGKAYRYEEGDYRYWQLDLLLPAGEFPEQSAVREIIFLLDCSGSMAGQSISEAKKALEICLRALPANCTFNVYRFGSTFHSFFSSPQRYSQDSLSYALRQLSTTDADLGGTQILPPLQNIFATAPAEVNRTIILLTDGEVGNEQELFDLTAAHRHGLRFFSIGIGAGPNEHLIKGLARAGNGAAEFIYPGERIEPKVLRIFSRLNSPKLDIKNIDWGGTETDQAPLSLAVFAGDVITLFARSKATGPFPDRLTVRGAVGPAERQWKFAVIAATTENLPLPQLWARERIRHLEDSDQAAGSRQVQRKESKNREAIIELSRTYRILSRHTSFVGIEEREEKEKTGGPVVLRKVPALITTGWHGTAAGVHFMIKRTEAPADHETFLMEMPALSSIKRSRSMHFRTLDKKLRVEKPEPTDILMELLNSQQGGGGFRIDDRLARLLGIRRKHLEKLSKKMTVSSAVDIFLLLSTVIVFEVLRARFAAQTRVWQALTEKSRVWLEDILQKGQPEMEGEPLREWAKQFVQKEIKLPEA